MALVNSTIYMYLPDIGINYSNVHAKLMLVKNHDKPPKLFANLYYFIKYIQ